MLGYVPATTTLEQDYWFEKMVWWMNILYSFLLTERRYSSSIHLFINIPDLLIHIEGRRAYPSKQWVEGWEIPWTTYIEKCNCDLSQCTECRFTSTQVYPVSDSHMFLNNATLLSSPQTHYEDGEHIIRQGARGDTFFIISKGKVRNASSALSSK